MSKRSAMVLAAMPAGIAASQPEVGSADLGGS